MTDLRQGIVETANALGMDPRVLATIISYETAGTFDPTKRGPTTQWGQHRGLIQFGEPQAKQYGVDWSDPLGSQLGPDGAIVKYFRASGWEPGMSEMDAYSVVNAGGPGRYGASDANNGGAPGTVADKVQNQFAGHREKAAAMLGGEFSPIVTSGGGGADSGQAANPTVPPADDWRSRIQKLFQSGGDAPATNLASMLSEQPQQQAAPPAQFTPRQGYQAPEDPIARAYRLLNSVRKV